MKLCQRVKQIASVLAGSQTSLGEALGFSSPRTFQGYLTESRQDNLWPLLPQILALYPQINRDWLYFGEGDMLGQEGEAPPAGVKPDEKDQLITELLLENRELRKRLEENRDDTKENVWQP